VIETLKNSGARQKPARRRAAEEPTEPKPAARVVIVSGQDRIGLSTLGRGIRVGAAQIGRNGTSGAVPAKSEPGDVLACLRLATQHQHARLDERLDAVARFSDPGQRRGLSQRYAAFHIPADVVLAPWLTDVPDLDLAARSRTPLLAAFASERRLPEFPAPASQAEALGMLYVLEGSTLGGRVITGALAARGVVDPDLAFLDPYREQTGVRWRGFLAVLDREVRDDGPIVEACRGAVRAFDHAEHVLCGEAA
jgi:heme oxygenase